MTLDELKARRDKARVQLWRLGTASLEHFNRDLDALLRLEGDVRVAEACEALEDHDAMMTAISTYKKYGYAWGRICGALADFLRARLTANESTPEETGR